MADVEITGLADLQRALEQLPAKIEGNIMRGGLRAAGVVIRDEAKRLCPVGKPRVTRTTGAAGGDVTLHKGGELRDSIRASARMIKREGKIQATVKAGNKKAWYAHLVEFGTAAHFIMPKSRKSLFFAGLAKEVVQHPGAKRQPFMRVAFDSKASAAIEAMADYIRTRLAKEARKK